MDASAVTLVTLLVFAWGLLSARLGRADLSAPIVFVAAGYLLAEVFHVIEADVSHEVIKVLAEVTLVWVLFADAARVRLRDLRSDAGIYARLLAIGLPLTMIGGTLLAWLMFDGIGFWLALLVGAALAPTDAALGAAVMSDPAVPARIRRVLNVESGLNDGIATPVVMVAVAGAATADSIAGSPEPRRRAGRSRHRPRCGGRSRSGGWTGDALRASPALVVGGVHGARRTGLGSGGVRSGALAGWQRIRGRLRGWARVRELRRSRRAQGGVLRRADGGPGVAPDLVALRCRRATRGDGTDRLAGGRLRRPQPDGDPDAAGGPRPDRSPVLACRRSASSGGSAPEAWPRSSSR